MTKKHSHSHSDAPRPNPEDAPPAAEPAPDAAPSPADAPPPPPADASSPDSVPATSPDSPLQTQLLRLQADFDNFRKRTAREKLDWAAYANEKLVLEILPVLDHFELGLADGAKNGAPESVVEGFRLIFGQLRGVLEKAGVQPIDAHGADFDPNLHEAITHLPSPDVPEGRVAAQTRRGYKLGDKLLRPAQVVVSSGPAAQ